MIKVLRTKHRSAYFVICYILRII